jgi:hypothetical protein
MKVLERNIANDIFAGYDVIWEEDAFDTTEVVHRLVTEYDFSEANDSTAKTIQKMREAEGLDDDDEFDSHPK